MKMKKSVLAILIAGLATVAWATPVQEEEAMARKLRCRSFLGACGGGRMT